MSGSSISSVSVSSFVTFSSDREEMVEERTDWGSSGEEVVIQGAAIREEEGRQLKEMEDKTVFLVYPRRWYILAVFSAFAQMQVNRATREMLFFISPLSRRLYSTLGAQLLRVQSLPFAGQTPM